MLRPAEQSSTFASGHASLAVDGSLETCSSTDESKNDYQRWWAVELPRAVNVKEVAVTINHDVAFHQQFTVFVIGNYDILFKLDERWNSKMAFECVLRNVAFEPF